KPEKHPNSIYDNAIVICQNGMARSAIYTGISLTGKYQNQRRKSCSLSYTFEITEDDNYQLSIGYSVNGTANPGKFSFIKQSPSTPAPMFNEIKYAELNKKYLSNRFAITDSNGMFDIENGTIVLNGKDTQSKSQYVEFGDVVQVDLISPNTLNSSNETTANINNTSGSFIIETKPEDLSQLSSATYNVIGESKYYLTASNDEIDFTWQSSSYNTMKIYNLDSGALIYSDYGNSYGVKRVSLTGVKYSQVVMSINDEQGINIIGL
ncbi:TPA: hypothetical protein ACSP2F_004065, partial [Aeromonas veronii]